jgi:SAM-dependent methyltransferase
MAMFKLAVKAAKRLYYDAFLAPRGYGRTLPQATWDLQYKQGDWEHLFSIDELAHYMVIAGYMQHLFESPRVLDVGCGPGRLLQLLSAFRFQSYLGIDLSAEAVSKAAGLGITKARFEVADFERWRPAELFDVMIFNESLYYAQRPLQVLSAFAECLDEGGLLVLSLCRYGNHGIIWKNVEAQFEALDSTTVENSKAQLWDIKVLRKKIVVTFP